MAAFYRRIPFVHVEAGLRSADIGSPFPEEYHRRMIAVTAALNCAPTRAAADHLRRENVPENSIHVTGNTVIDALLQTAKSRPSAPTDFPDVPRPILLTAHRRENFGAPMREALLAIRDFVDRNPDTAIFFPVHPNPAARDVALETMCEHPRIILRKPLAYRDLVASIQRSWAVVTDSGGLQEEAPALGKPVLVLREETERPEAVEAGVVRIIGTRRKNVLENLQDLSTKSTYRQMARPVFPYGNGRSAEKIMQLLPKVLPTTYVPTSIAS
jgi:UDP-N-acetylglucosamine 2-epimerase (non-hydrolysing)